MRLRLTTSASLIALLATPAFAQTSPPTDGDAIVVTAQKREQNLQDVPIAITAVSGQALRDQRIRTIDEIGTQVSNTQIYQDKGGSQPNWTIRGVSLFDFNVNNSPSTSIFIDDVYQPSTVLGAGGIFDLQRVEVLKGPQAGLYGRNSVGGAVQIISHEPKPGDTDGYVNVDYGSWNRYRIEAAQSLSLGRIRRSGFPYLTMAASAADGRRAWPAGENGASLIVWRCADCSVPRSARLLQS